MFSLQCCLDAMAPGRQRGVPEVSSPWGVSVGLGEEGGVAEKGAVGAPVGAVLSLCQRAGCPALGWGAHTRWGGPGPLDQPLTGPGRADFPLLSLSGHTPAQPPSPSKMLLKPEVMSHLWPLSPFLWMGVYCEPEASTHSPHTHSCQSNLELFSSPFYQQIN